MNDDYKEIKLLDHGFIRLVDKMGDDSAIVQAARTSYGKGTKTVNVDRGLIRYLMRHDHASPFEMVSFKFHVKMPIFIARQWIRHRTAKVNEYSGRYSIMEDDFYIPSVENLAAQSTKNHQGREDIPLSDKESKEVLSILKGESEGAYTSYLDLLNRTKDDAIVDETKTGVARELARMVLPVNYYTQWYWKCDLRNIFNFIRLRNDSHAQYEIRVYAQAMYDIVNEFCPLACEAFDDYVANGVKFSKQEIQALSVVINGGRKLDEEILKGGELKEFQAKLLKHFNIELDD